MLVIKLDELIAGVMEADVVTERRRPVDGAGPTPEVTVLGEVAVLDLVMCSSAA